MRFSFFAVLFSSSAVLFSQSDFQDVGGLPNAISETSGLIFFNGHLITHNDSGNEPQLYELDTVSLQVVRTVTITNVANIDWEDITQDDQYIYIGDIGNNSGDRADLKILKISKTEYLNSDSVTADTIDYFYEDQNDFSATQGSDFDAEALFAVGDNLIILTKQWQTMGTVAYRLPKISGAFLAERLGNYEVDGLVTGATYDADVQELYLIGYSQFLIPFFVRIEEVDTNTIFSGNQEKIELSGIAQMEAITKVGDTFYTTSEQFNNTNPPVSSASRLFRFSLDDDQEPGGGEEPIDPMPGPEPDLELEDSLILYRASGSSILHYRVRDRLPIHGRGIFDSTGRLIQFTPLEYLGEESIDLSTLRPAVYHLAFFYGDRILSKSFVFDH